MKKYPFVSKIATITGLALGAFALSALAAGTWTAPSTAAPYGNVDAPINVGGTVATPQYKTGALGIGTSYGNFYGELFHVYGVGVIDNLFAGNAMVGGYLSANNLRVRPGNGVTGKYLKAINDGGEAVWDTPVSTVTQSYRVELYNCMNTTYIADAPTGDIGAWMCPQSGSIVTNIHSNGGDWGGRDYAQCCNLRVVAN